MKKYALFFAAMLLLVSCQKDVIENDTALKSMVDGVCYPDTYQLRYGQANNGGTLVVSNDETNLYVTYNSPIGFEELHLWVGTDLLNVPTNKPGQPIPGQFPYKDDLPDGKL